MDNNFVATTLNLTWAIEDRLAAYARLAQVRMEVAVAQFAFEAAIERHNANYRDRVEARLEAQQLRDNEETDQAAENADFLRTYADWCERESSLLDVEYCRAQDRLEKAKEKARWYREAARRCDRELHQLLVAFREGSIADSEPLPALDEFNDYLYGLCDCPYCTELYEQAYDPNGEDFDSEQEQLSLDALRRRRQSQKAKADKLARTRQRA